MIPESQSIEWTETDYQGTQHLGDFQATIAENGRALINGTGLAQGGGRTFSMHLESEGEGHSAGAAGASER